jgi:hypothetical protein
MNTPAAIGRLQARGASLIYQTIGYQTIGATGPSTMPFIFQHGWVATRTSPWATRRRPAHPGDQSERARPQSQHRHQTGGGEL